MGRLRFRREGSATPQKTLNGLIYESDSGDELIVERDPENENLNPLTTSYDGADLSTETSHYTKMP